VEILTLAVHTTFGAAVGMITKRQQRGDVVVGDEPDIPTVSPVSTVRAAVHDRALATEADTARATVTSTYVELTLVDELGHRCEANAGLQATGSILRA
jgi:hypothetical protein